MDNVTISLTVPAMIAVPVTFQREVISVQPVDVSRLPQDVLLHLFNYGVRQSLNDAKAGATREDAAAMVAKRLNRFYNNEFGKAGPSGAGDALTPVEKEARKLARETIRAKLKADGIALKTVTEDNMEKMVSTLAARADYVAKAEEIVAIKTGPAGPAFTLEDLGLNAA